MINIGFTGTRKGVTADQLKTLERILLNLAHGKEACFHHGMCIGADKSFHILVRNLFPEASIIGYPSNIYGTKCNVHVDLEHIKKNPLDRNQDIVNACNWLVVCPAQNEEVLRSGTWATYRRALRKNKPYSIIYPDGSYFGTSICTVIQ